MAGFDDWPIGHVQVVGVVQTTPSRGGREYGPPPPPPSQSSMPGRFTGGALITRELIPMVLIPNDMISCSPSTKLSSAPSLTASPSFLIRQIVLMYIYARHAHLQVRTAVIHTMGKTSAGKTPVGKILSQISGQYFSGLLKGWDRIFPGQLKDC